MEIDLALLADAATVDASGKLNILGIFDRIGAQNFPVQHPHIALVLRFVASLAEAGKHKVEIRLKGGGGKPILNVGGELHVGPGSSAMGGRVRIPQVVNIERIVFPEPGPYGFDVLLDGEHQVTVPLVVHDARPGGPAAKA